MNVWEVIASICAGLAVCIPLAVRLAVTVRECVQKGNWYRIVGMVSRYMAKAEELLEDGTSRKEWVIAMLHENAAALDYELTVSDWQKIADMIDTLCAMAKTVNAEVAA